MRVSVRSDLQNPFSHWFEYVRYSCKFRVYWKKCVYFGRHSHEELFKSPTISVEFVYCRYENTIRINNYICVAFERKQKNGRYTGVFDRGPVREGFGRSTTIRLSGGSRLRRRTPPPSSRSAACHVIRHYIDYACQSPTPPGGAHEVCDTVQSKY